MFMQPIPLTHSPYDAVGSTLLTTTETIFGLGLCVAVCVYCSIVNYYNLVQYMNVFLFSGLSFSLSLSLVRQVCAGVSSAVQPRNDQCRRVNCKSSHIVSIVTIRLLY